MKTASDIIALRQDLDQSAKELLELRGWRRLVLGPVLDPDCVWYKRLPEGQTAHFNEAQALAWEKRQEEAAQAVEPERPKTCLTDGSPVTDDHREIDPVTGMQKGYVVLCEEERIRGFVRPVRLSYRHAGAKPSHPLRDLTEDETARYAQFGYVKFEAYPDGDSAMRGRFWTQAQLTGCGSVTNISRAIAETFAKDPKFYSSTFCCSCRAHFPLSEFEWEDGTVVGS